MFYEVKSFCHIHEATVHVATIPDEVVDSLDYSPCAHVRGNTRLVGKLEVINPKFGPEQNQDNPIK